MENKKNVSLILPVFNQEDHIEELYVSYADVLEKAGYDFEIIFVANGCTDGTPQGVAALNRKYPSCNSIVSEGKGWGHAVKLGIKKASGYFILYTNSARTKPDTLLTAVKYAFDNPGSVIKATRLFRKSWMRRMGSFIYNIECRLLFNLPCWDMNGTPKVFARENTLLMGLKREDDLIDLEFNVICRKHGFKVLEFPVIATDRIGGRSTTNYGSAVRMYAGALSMKIDDMLKRQTVPGADA